MKNLLILLLFISTFGFAQKNKQGKIIYTISFRTSPNYKERILNNPASNFQTKERVL